MNVVSIYKEGEGKSLNDSTNKKKEIIGTVITKMKYYGHTSETIAQIINISVDAINDVSLMENHEVERFLCFEKMI